MAKVRMGFLGRRKYVRWNLEKDDTEFYWLHEVFHLFSPVFLFPLKNEKCIQIYANYIPCTQNRKSRRQNLQNCHSSRSFSL